MKRLLCFFALIALLYGAWLGFVKWGSAKQSTVETLSVDQQNLSPIEEGKEEDPLCATEESSTPLIPTPPQIVIVEKEDKKPILIQHKDHSTICLNMIVKNESKVIRRCLETLKPLIDYWVIVDTGSTDGTQKIIKEFMKGIPGELHERPWVNFAHNRNEALALAQHKADYLFFIDADDKVEISPSFRKSWLNFDCYNIDINYNGMTYGRTAFVKADQPWKWVGSVHEVLVYEQPHSSGHLSEITMRILGGGDRSQDPKKFLKDAALLEKELEEKPGHGRTQFYLAQSYKDAEMPELALTHYQRRVDLGGWDQELFWSLYQIALLQEELKKPEKEIVKGYTQAYLYRPTRLEPLYQLCSYYRRQENYLMGYLVGSLALDAFGSQSPKFLAHPLDDGRRFAQQLDLTRSTDALFVETWMYDYGFLLEHSICAYWIGKYQECKDICDYLLARPDLPMHVRDCVQRNRQFSIDQLAEKRSIPLQLLKAG